MQSPQLDAARRVKLDTLQGKVSKYQHDPTLCAALTHDQAVILADLQALYNLLSNKKMSTMQPMYNTTCKRVTDQMKEFTSKYQRLDGEQLYEMYMRTYRDAKEGDVNRPGLYKLLDA